MTDDEQKGNPADDTPFIRMANSILGQAIRKGATEIYVEPAVKSFGISSLIDGELRPATLKSVEILHRIDGDRLSCTRLPGRVEQGLVVRYKDMAGMNVQEHGVAQDGHFTFTDLGVNHICRVRSEPIEQGERLVISLATELPE